MSDVAMARPASRNCVPRRRRNIAYGLQQPAIVEPVDPGQRRELHGFEGSPPPVPMDQLGFVESVDRLGESIVIDITLTADGGVGTGFSEALGRADADILRTAIRLMHLHTAVCMSALVRSLLQRVGDEARFEPSAIGPADSPPSIASRMKARRRSPTRC